MHVLSGDKYILEKAHPSIFLATHGDERQKQCCQFLTSLGYQLRPIAGNSLEQTDEIFAYYET